MIPEFWHDSVHAHTVCTGLFFSAYTKEPGDEGSDNAVLVLQ